METQETKTVNRKKAWYQLKIEELEAKVKELEAMVGPVNAVATIKLTPAEQEVGVHFESYAEGYASCLTKYALLPKEKRRIIKANIITQGPKYVGQSAWTRMKF